MSIVLINVLMQIFFIYLFIFIVNMMVNGRHKKLFLQAHDVKDSKRWLKCENVCILIVDFTFVYVCTSANVADTFTIVLAMDCE